MEKPRAEGVDPAGMEREQHIQHVVQKLTSPEFREAFILESTSEGQVAVNTVVDIRTGEIILFSNYADTMIEGDSSLTYVVFLLHGNQFVDVSERSFRERSIAPEAMENLKEGMRRVNEMIKKNK